jgi:hypothetical protein
MRGMGLLLLALVATASALTVERCEVRTIDVEQDSDVIPLAVFLCYTDGDLYVNTPKNASLAPILFTSTAKEVNDHLAGTSDTADGKLNFAGEWTLCPRKVEQMPPFNGRPSLVGCWLSADCSWPYPLHNRLGRWKER